VDDLANLAKVVNSTSNKTSINLQGSMRYHDLASRFDPIRNNRDSGIYQTICVKLHSRIDCPLGSSMGELATAETFPVGIKFARI